MKFHPASRRSSSSLSLSPDCNGLVWGQREVSEADASFKEENKASRRGRAQGSSDPPSAQKGEGRIKDPEERLRPDSTLSRRQY